MEQTVNERVTVLKKHLNLTNEEFVLKTKLSRTTLWTIQNGTEMKPKTINTICDALNVNKKWLLSGDGEMFNQKPIEAPEAKKQAEIEVWQDATYKSLQDQIATLKALVNHLSGGKLNFHKLLTETGPEQSELLRAAA